MKFNYLLTILNGLYPIVEISLAQQTDASEKKKSVYVSKESNVRGTIHVGATEQLRPITLSSNSVNPFLPIGVADCNLCLQDHRVAKLTESHLV